MFDIGVISTKGSYINRTIKDIPLALIKSSIGSELVDEKVVSYFIKDELETKIENYFNISLKDKVKMYKISYFYFVFNENNEPIYDSSKTPKNLQLSFNCNFYKTFVINQSLTFKINEIWR